MTAEQNSTHTPTGIRRDETDLLREAMDIEIGAASLEKLTKQARDLSEEIAEGVLYDIKDNLASWLADHVSSTASSVIEAILNGNEHEARRYLGLKPEAYYDGRDFKPWFNTNSKLHTAGPVELRRKIVEAHRDLITDARVADLEAQVKMLCEKYYRMEHADLPRMREELRVANHELEQWRAAGAAKAVQS